MYSVKLENDKRRSPCHGCLSTGRHLFTLKEQSHLFFNLLGSQQELCDTRISLCWECSALLRRIQSFQNRIQHAQFILQQSLYDQQNFRNTSLSSLSITKKDFFDRTFDHDEYILINENTSKKFKISIKLENTEDDDNLQFNDNNDDSVPYSDHNDGLSDNEILNINIDKLKELGDSGKEEKNKKSHRKLSIKRYESKATVKKLDVDISDLKKHYTTVCLSEKEIEDVLVRDKQCWGYRKLPNSCSQCKNTYRRKVDLRRHETFNHIKHTFPTKCKECGAKVQSYEDLSSHWGKHNVYNMCSLCGWLSQSVSSMTRHFVRAHTKVYFCKACDANCKTLREFSVHYRERHEKIICDHCGKSFMKKTTLEKHIKRHHTPATCNECNRTYAHYHVLENHYRMYHPHLIRADTRTELAYCVECDKQFPSVYKYRRHLATAAKHTPPKPVRVPCPECGKVFARKIRMTNHYNSVHMNNTKHRCDICNKTFCSAFSARTHRQHVHEKIPLPKNKMCDICGRGFSTNRILTNHRRTHTGERPYKCLYCPATFAQRTAMKTHEKTQHKNVALEPP